MRLLALFVLVYPLAFLPPLENPVTTFRTFLLQAFFVAAAGFLLLCRQRREWMSGGRLAEPLGGLWPLLPWVVALAAIFTASPLKAQNLLGTFGRDEGLLVLFIYPVLAALSFTIVRRARRRGLRPFKLIYRAVGLAGLLASLHGLAQLVGYPLFVSSVDPGRVAGPFANPVSFATFLSLAVPFVALPLLALDMRRGDCALATASTVAMTAALLFTYSRIAWLAVALVMLGSVGFLWRRRLLPPGLPWRRLLAVASLVVLLAAVVVAVNLGARRNVISPLGRVGPSVASEGSTRTRLEGWGVALKIVARQPLGVGPAGFRALFPRYRSDQWERLASQTMYADKVHQNLLETALAAGPLGLLSYMWFLIWFFWSSARAIDAGGIRKDARTGSKSAVSVLAGAAGLAAYFTALQTSFSWIEVAPIAWIIVGVTVASRPRRTEALAGSKSARPITVYRGRPLAVVWAVFAVAASAVLLAPARAVVAGYYAGAYEEALSAGDSAGAYDYAARASKSNPWVAEYAYYEGKARLERARAGGGLADALGAGRSFRRALRIDPYEFKAYYGLAQANTLCYGLTGKTSYLTQTRLVLDRWESLDRNFSTVHSSYGELLELEKKPKAARQAYRQALRLNPAGKWARQGLERIDAASVRR